MGQRGRVKSRRREEGLRVQKKRKGLRWDKGGKVQVGQSERIRKVLSTV